MACDDTHEGLSASDDDVAKLASEALALTPITAREIRKQVETNVERLVGVVEVRRGNVKRCFGVDEFGKFSPEVLQALRSPTVGPIPSGTVVGEPLS